MIDSLFDVFLYSQSRCGDRIYLNHEDNVSVEDEYFVLNILSDIFSNYDFRLVFSYIKSFFVFSSEDQKRKNLTKDPVESNCTNNCNIDHGDDNNDLKFSLVNKYLKCSKKNVKK